MGVVPAQATKPVAASMVCSLAMATMAGSTWAVPPHKFEAGTPPIAQAVGIGAAVDYLTDLGMDNVRQHEHELTSYALEALQQIDGLRIIGTASHKASVISFVLEGVHPHDIGTILDQDGIAIRTGHHCAQPIMLRFNIPATGRASFGMYNTLEEADFFVEGLRRVIEVFR